MGQSNRKIPPLDDGWVTIISAEPEIPPRGGMTFLEALYGQGQETTAETENFPGEKIFLFPEEMRREGTYLEHVPDLAAWQWVIDARASGGADQVFITDEDGFGFVEIVPEEQVRSFGRTFPWACAIEEARAWELAMEDERMREEDRLEREDRLEEEWMLMMEERDDEREETHALKQELELELKRHRDDELELEWDLAQKREEEARELERELAAEELELEWELARKFEEELELEWELARKRELEWELTMKVVRDWETQKLLNALYQESEEKAREKKAAKKREKERRAELEVAKKMRNEKIPEIEEALRDWLEDVMDSVMKSFPEGVIERIGCEFDDAEKFPRAAEPAQPILGFSEKLWNVLRLPSRMWRKFVWLVSGPKKLSPWPEEPVQEFGRACTKTRQKRALRRSCCLRHI